MSLLALLTEFSGKDIINDDAEKKKFLKASGTKKKSAFQAIVSLFEKELTDDMDAKDVAIIVKIIAKFNSSVKNINTKSKNITTIRKIVKNKYGDNSLHFKATKKLISLTKEEFTEKINNEKAVRKKKLSKLIDVNIKDTIDIIKKIRTSKNWIDQFIVVAMATGLRSIEILKLASFEKSKKPNHIIVTGLAKTKNKVKKNLERPLLFISHKLLQVYMKNIRKNIKEGDNIRTQNLYNARINKRIKQLFGRFTAHDMRRIYGIFAVKIKKPENMDECVFISEILGHEENNLDSCMNYRTIKLTHKKVDVKPVKKEPTPRVLELKKIIKERKDNGLPTTHKVLKSLGFGSSTISKATKLI